MYMSNCRGITIVEALVGISILGIILVAISLTQTQFFAASGTVLNTTQATYLAEEGQEFVRYLRDEDWNQLSGLTNGTDYYFDVTSGDIDITATPEVINGVFTRHFTLSELKRDANDDFVESGGSSDTGGRVVTVTVSWGTESVSLSALVTNLHNI